MLLIHDFANSMRLKMIKRQARTGRGGEKKGRPITPVTTRLVKTNAEGKTSYTWYLVRVNPFRTAVPFGGKPHTNQSSLPPNGAAVINSTTRKRWNGKENDD